MGECFLRAVQKCNDGFSDLEEPSGLKPENRSPSGPVSGLQERSGVSFIKHCIGSIVDVYGAPKEKFPCINPISVCSYTSTFNHEWQMNRRSMVLCNESQPQR